MLFCQSVGLIVHETDPIDTTNQATTATAPIPPPPVPQQNGEEDGRQAGTTRALLLPSHAPCCGMGSGGDGGTREGGREGGADWSCCWLLLTVLTPHGASLACPPSLPTGQEEEGEGGVHDEAYVKGMFEVLAMLAQARDRRPAAQFVRSGRAAASID